MIALEHEGIAFDSAATPERGFQPLQPFIALGAGEIKMLDHGDLFPLPAAALDPDDGASDRAGGDRGCGSLFACLVMAGRAAA